MSKYLRFAITGLLLSWIAWKTDWAVVARAFANLDVGYWLAAVGLLVCAQVISAKRWQVFANQFEMPRTVWQLAKYYFIGMYFNLLLPTSVGGDVVRVWYLNGHSGRKLRATAAVLLDRINGLMVLVGLACVAVLFAPPETPSWVPLCVYGIAAAGVCGVVMIAVIARWNVLPENRRQQMALFLEILRHPQSLMLTTLLSVVVQIVSAAIVWLVGQGLHLDVPVGYYAVFVPMVTLLTLLPSINGMGLREWGCVIFLAPMGIEEPLALTLAFLWFAVQLSVSVLGGLVYLFGHEKGVRTLSDEISEEDKNEEKIEAKEAARGSVDRDSDQGREGQRRRAA